MKTLRILLVEDSEDDALLIVREIQRGGYVVTSARVEDGATFRHALADGAWDVVLSDWTLPRFSAREALDLVRELGVGVPVIVVSGAMDDTTVRDALECGARGYVLKDRRAALVTVIEREIGERRK